MKQVIIIRYLYFCTFLTVTLCLGFLFVLVYLNTYCVDHLISVGALDMFVLCTVLELSGRIVQ